MIPRQEESVGYLKSLEPEEQKGGPGSGPQPHGGGSRPGGNQPSGIEGIEMIGGHLDFRELGKRGMHAVSAKFGPPKVGQDIDYYARDTEKRYGVVTSIDSSGKMKVRDGATRKPVTLQLVNEVTGANYKPKK